MLHDGVVEESHGAWGFPVVLVKKKDGSVRFCIDYRMLNAVTKRDVYPLPRIDDTLDQLHGSRRFTSLDLHSGYWQVPVAAKDRDKTGFVTRRGLYRFVRMPFGLANAPGTFQRMMNAVLRGLTWQTCLVYLDDVIIFTKGDVAQHVVELATVLERLSQAGLSLKAKKCTFAATKLQYLGHELDAEGVRPMESLVRSVVEFPMSTDSAEVKRFVHMAGYYRRFVPDFASRASVMTKLLRKGVVWRWGQSQQTAFEDLKRALTDRPLLAYPDFRKPFRLITDASKTGLGATLTQDQGQGEQPIAYASRVNSETVSKYSITDLECAAVIWAVKLFRPYLYGRRFELITDHAALKYLMTSKDLTGRMHRWSL
ncbi:Gag-pol fusion protein [Phytophthora megakarya]|uniref:Gag-pol fusion protein n=1 Tax=Phytophthora megakarya TaxID=4795 RepID=A0A225VMK3_9STRA|nr:Gag-pol fusion protein [Phytophthora megakarya]